MKNFFFLFFSKSENNLLLVPIVHGSLTQDFTYDLVDFSLRISG